MAKWLLTDIYHITHGLYITVGGEWLGVSRLGVCTSFTPNQPHVMKVHSKRDCGQQEAAKSMLNEMISGKMMT